MSSTLRPPFLLLLHLATALHAAVASRASLLPAAHISTTTRSPFDRPAEEEPHQFQVMVRSLTPAPAYMLTVRAKPSTTIRSFKEIVRERMQAPQEARLLFDDLQLRWRWPGLTMRSCNIEDGQVLGMTFDVFLPRSLHFSVSSNDRRLEGGYIVPALPSMTVRALKERLEEGLLSRTGLETRVLSIEPAQLLVHRNKLLSQDISEHMTLEQCGWIAKNVHVTFKAKAQTMVDWVREDVCGICLSTMSLSEKLVTTWCRHFFHEECIDPWFERSQVCPTCKEPCPK